MMSKAAHIDMKPIHAWILRLIPAVIIGQTLPFKFSGAAQSRELFSTLTEKVLNNPGLEALARVGTGVVELIAVILLLIPQTSLKGAFLTAAVMAGALISHVLYLGFAGANGQLAGMAAVALIFCAVYLFKQTRSTDLSQVQELGSRP